MTIFKSFKAYRFDKHIRARSFSLLVVINIIGTTATSQTETSSQIRNSLLRTETQNGSVLGDIVAITQDGSVTLADGSVFFLWGMHDFNVSEATKFLTSRRALCLDVVTYKGVPVRDCTIMSTPTTEISAVGKLSLFFWFEELGIASHRCDERDQLPEKVRAIIHSAGLAFTCDVNGYPVNIVVSEN